MRSDLLSKRIFIAGSFFLPWLWIVHVLYAAKGSPENDEGLLNPDDHFQEDDADAETTDLSPEEIQMEAQKWIQRCKYGAVVATALFLGWVIIAQVLRGSVFPPSLYMLNSDTAEVTGW